MYLILVTGFVRTGSSAVTGLIKRMGATTLPETVVGDYNPDYHENVILNGLLESITHWHKKVKTRGNLHVLNAIASYILEHYQGRPMVIKSPSIGPAIGQFEWVFHKIQELTGERIDPIWVLPIRNSVDVARSANRFTNDYFGVEYMAARYIEYMDDVYKTLTLNDDTVVEVYYDRLLKEPARVAIDIADHVPGLIVPGETGINPELRHFHENE